MTPIKLSDETGKHTVWACGACGKVCPKDYVEKCCVCTHCEKPITDRKAGDATTTHSHCWREASDVREQKQMDAATEVDVKEYDGMVYHADYPYDNGYASSIDYMTDHFWSEVEEAPEFAFCCTPQSAYRDISYWIEGMTQDGYEDMYLESTKELETAAENFRKFNEAALVVWHTDYSKKIRIERNPDFKQEGVTR